MIFIYPSGRHLGTPCPFRIIDFLDSRDRMFFCKIGVGGGGIDEGEWDFTGPGARRSEEGTRPAWAGKRVEGRRGRERRGLFYFFSDSLSSWTLFPPVYHFEVFRFFIHILTWRSSAARVVASACMIFSFMCE